MTADLTELRHRFIMRRADAQMRHTDALDEMLCDLLNSIGPDNVRASDPPPTPATKPAPAPEPKTMRVVPRPADPVVPTPARAAMPAQEPASTTDPTPVVTPPPEPPAGRERDGLLLRIGEYTLAHTHEACSNVVGDDVRKQKGRRETTIAKWLEALDAHDWTPEPIEEAPNGDDPDEAQDLVTEPEPTPEIVTEPAPESTPARPVAEILTAIARAESRLTPEAVREMRSDRGLDEDGALDEHSAGPVGLGLYLDLLEGKLAIADDMPF